MEFVLFALADDFTNEILGSYTGITDTLPSEPLWSEASLETIGSSIFHAISAHNRGDFETAEMLYTKILNQKPNKLVASVMYKPP